MNKSELLQFGVQISKEFLLHNDYELPVYRDADKTKDRIYGTCGHYWNGRVVISASLCSNIAGKNQVRLWSYPTYKIDRTPVGVAAHETGHYIDHVLGYPSDRFGLAVKSSKKVVSGYEPNLSEAFAETARLFILNPTLLKEAIPSRYEFFIDRGLVPSTDRHWSELLKDAGQRFLDAAEKFTK